MALDDRETAFVEMYFEHKGNCRAAAVAAGYADSTARNAHRWLDEKTMQDGTVQNSTKNKCRYKPELAEAIEKRREELKRKLSADADEVIETVTAILRRELEDEVPTVVGTGNGYSEVVNVTKKPSIKDVMSAASLLARIFGMEKTNLNVEGGLPVVISGSDSLAD